MRVRDSLPVCGCPARSRGRRRLRSSRARSPGRNSTDRRDPGVGLGPQLATRGQGGAGVPDSRISVLKATTPSSPCRKMPKLCMSAPLSQRPAPDATVEAGPPGSPRLTFPPGPCMTAWRQGARAAPPSRDPGPGAGSRYLRPRPPPRRA